MAGGRSGKSTEHNAMTAKDTVTLISGSSLWKTLSIKERLDAVAYAMKISGSKLEEDDICDIIGEVYAG